MHFENRLLIFDQEFEYLNNSILDIVSKFKLCNSLIKRELNVEPHPSFEILFSTFFDNRYNSFTKTYIAALIVYSKSYSQSAFDEILLDLSNFSTQTNDKILNKLFMGDSKVESYLILWILQFHPSDENIRGFLLAFLSVLDTQISNSEFKDSFKSIEIDSFIFILTSLINLQSESISKKLIEITEDFFIYFDHSKFQENDNKAIENLRLLMDFIFKNDFKSNLNVNIYRLTKIKLVTPLLCLVLNLCRESVVKNALSALSKICEGLLSFKDYDALTTLLCIIIENIPLASTYFSHGNIWDIIKNCINSDRQITRKRSIYIFNKLLDYSTEISTDPMFKVNVKNKSKNKSKDDINWTKIYIDCFNQIEGASQLHLVQQIWPSMQYLSLLLKLNLYDDSQLVNNNNNNNNNKLVHRVSESNSLLFSFQWFKALLNIILSNDIPIIRKAALNKIFT